jgi:hypothetical protein
LVVRGNALGLRLDPNIVVYKDARPGAHLANASAAGEYEVSQRKLLIGGDGIALEAFLSRPVQFWTKRNSGADV